MSGDYRLLATMHTAQKCSECGWSNDDINWTTDRIADLESHVKAVVDAWDSGAIALWTESDIAILRNALKRD
jgi:hypothetical protein